MNRLQAILMIDIGLWLIIALVVQAIFSIT
jgi:hypothetical protein